MCNCIAPTPKCAAWLSKNSSPNKTFPCSFCWISLTVGLISDSISGITICWTDFGKILFKTKLISSVCSWLILLATTAKTSTSLCLKVSKASLKFPVISDIFLRYPLAMVTKVENADGDQFFWHFYLVKSMVIVKSSDGYINKIQFLAGDLLIKLL